ncbi:Glutaredoxin-like protein NrdH [Microbacterium ginsengisoli]|uniref:Glutaredoxin-like protein NrdH n=1 Tax=Microbacterium ginsengisoli TaxID=400772 RepID=A0A0F0LXQ9_9MICO|nr:glutaredoxin family protein [Microbacterium ginsengisoli]KJL37075.1 Glutaredoxin-like protein NrdH [Microbacterium ginsengisoli]
MSLPSHLTAPPSGDITVWTKPSCVQCTAVKRRLTEAGVPFTERDLTAEEHESDLEYFRKLGYRSAPITAHGAVAVPGFVPAEIDRIIAAWRAEKDAEVGA